MTKTVLLEKDNEIPQASGRILGIHTIQQRHRLLNTMKFSVCSDRVITGAVQCHACGLGQTVS